MKILQVKYFTGENIPIYGYYVYIHVHVYTKIKYSQVIVARTRLACLGVATILSSKVQCLYGALMIFMVGSGQE